MSSGRRPLTARRCRKGVVSAELVAEPGVEKVGIKFVSFPPGKVIVKQAALGMWAAEQGVVVGAELAAINGQQVANMSKDEFVRAMAERPLLMHMMLDPRQVTSELTMTSSASSVLSVISPWVGGPHLNQIHAATAIYRLAVHEADFTDRIANSLVFKSLIGRTRQLLENNDMESRPLSNIFWAIGKLFRHAGRFEGLFPALLGAARKRMAEMSARDASNILWAIASLRVAAPRLVELAFPIAECLVERRLGLIAQEVSNSFWSIAKLRKDRTDLREFALALAEIATEQAPKMNQQNIANTAWAAGLLQLDGEAVRKMLAALRQQAVVLFGSFKAQSLANTCYGFAVLGSLDSMFMSSAAAAVMRNEKRWSTHEVVYDLKVIIWASATINFESDQLLELVARRLMPHIEAVNDWGLCALVWSYVKLDRRNVHVDFRRVLKAEVSRRGFNAQLVSRARFGPYIWNGEE